MLKHTSILTQITGFMVLLTVFAVIGMGLTNQITESVQGNAHAINKSGTLRMQSYRFLSEIPLTAHSQQYLDDFESDLTLLAGMKAVSPAKIQRRNSRKTPVRWWPRLSVRLTAWCLPLTTRLNPPSGWWRPFSWSLSR